MQHNFGRGNHRGGFHDIAPRTSQALNCIVDESALLAGLESSDGLKKWIRQGSINVFVPLYTLEKLNLLRSSPPPLNLTARQTLEWLDHITSVTENKTAGHVGLQGPDDQYQTWGEVEKYLLPETPLSSRNGHDTLDGVAERLESNLQIENDSRSPRVNHETAETTARGGSLSPGAGSEAGPEIPSGTHGPSHKKTLSLASTISVYSEDEGAEQNSTFDPTVGTSAIPSSVRPLLNYVVWRTYNESASVVGSGKYILLTNDPSTRKQAQQFGVRAKLLSQVRTIVSRSERKAAGNGAFKGTPYSREAASEDYVHEERDGGVEDEVVFNPASRPGSSRDMQPTIGVWDPDHFGRTPVPTTLDADPNAVIKDIPAAGQRPTSRGNAAGGPGGAASGARGQGRPTRGQNPPSARGLVASARGSPRHKLEKPIDPDSYARPPPPSRGRGGRGGSRRLWEPNT